MGAMDQGIKRLVQSHPADLLALALPSAEFIAALPMDVATEPQLVLDTLLRIRYEGVECAVDIEAEAYPRPDIGERLDQYAARAKIVTGLKVISVVLWLNAGGPAPASPYEDRVGDLVLSTRHFFGIELYRLPADALLGRGLPGLLPLVAFTQSAGDAATIERAAEEIKARVPARDELQELETLLAVFASRTIGNELAKHIVGRVLMSNEILESSPLYQEWVSEARQQGLERGLRTGILTVLRQRFPEVPPDIEQALAAAHQDRLQDVLDHVLTDGIDDVRTRLAR